MTKRRYRTSTLVLREARRIWDARSREGKKRDDALVTAALNLREVAHSLEEVERGPRRIYGSVLTRVDA